MKYKREFILGLYVIQFLFLILFFDPKLHIGGDDSDYITAAVAFIQGESFPSWHGSFYPIFLSPFIAVSGIHVILLKFVSVILTILSLYFIAKSFTDRVPNAVLYFALSITAFSFTLSYYGSTTYSEPLFLFFQSLIFYFLARLLEIEKNAKPNQTIFLWIALALITFLLSITRNIGFGAFFAIVVFLFAYKHWKHGAVIIVLFSFLHGVYFLYKKVYWHHASIGFEGQLSKIAYKNFYNPSHGSEDLLGFIARFYYNSNLYLSKHLAKMFGIRSLEAQTVWPMVTVLFYLFFSLALIISYRKNRFLFFTTLYILILLAVTFLTLQTHWDQERLIMAYLPLIAMVIGFLINEIAIRKVLLFSWAAKAIFILIPCLVLIQTLTVPKTIWTAISNMTHDKYHGYPEAWKNYSLVCEWAGKNINKEQHILCRKPGIAQVYGNRKFVGISSFYYEIPDSAEALLKRKDIDYVILDDLSMPTVQRLLKYFLIKYPLGLKKVYASGVTNPSIVLKVAREAPTSNSDYINRVSVGMTLFPDAPYYFVLAANNYFETQNYEEAIRYYSFALSANPGSDEGTAILINRAISYLQLQKMDKAKTDLDAALLKNAKDKKAWRVLANVYLAMGLKSKADEAYSKSQTL